MCEFRIPYFKKDKSEVPYGGHWNYPEWSSVDKDKLESGYWYSVRNTGSFNFYQGNEEDVEWKYDPYHFIYPSGTRKCGPWKLNGKWVEYKKDENDYFVLIRLED